VAEDSQFHIRLEEGQEIIQTEDPDILAYWGLPQGNTAELTPEEVLDLDKRASSRRYEEIRRRAKSNHGSTP
jgi:hypothetical protein